MLPTTCKVEQAQARLGMDKSGGVSPFGGVDLEVKQHLSAVSHVEAHLSPTDQELAAVLAS